VEIAEHSQRLKEGEVSLLGAVMSGAAIMAPAASILFGVAVVASIAGSAVPLIFVIAMLGVLATGNSLARFAREWPSAGSFVTFITRIFGSTVGLWIGVITLLGWLIAYAAVYLFIGDFIAADFLGGTTSKWATAAAMIGFIAVVMVPVVRGVSISVKVSLLALAVEVVVIGIICIAVILDGGPKGVSFDAFAFPDGGFQPVALGFAVTVFLFGGFEQPVPLAEETKHPRRNVPLAVFLCVVGIGALYILASWVLVVAFGDGAALAQQTDPLHAAADQYVSWLAPVVKFVLLSSFLGFGVAAITAVSRIIFNTARDGLLPAQLGQLHPKYKTPAAAAGAFAGLGLLIGLASKPLTDTLTAVTLLSTAGSLLIISMYVLINAALIVWWARERSEGRHHNPIACVLVPLAGIVVLAAPYYYNLKPGQPSPLDDVPWALAVCVLIGTLFVAWVRAKRPDRMADAGQVLAGEAGVEVEVAAGVPV
jgi:amino acid transporter